MGKFNKMRIVIPRRMFICMISSHSSRRLAGHFNSLYMSAIGGGNLFSDNGLTGCSEVILKVPWDSTCTSSPGWWCYRFCMKWWCEGLRHYQGPVPSRAIEQNSGSLICGTVSKRKPMFHLMVAISHCK
jgi:hypothetical protein